MTTLNLRDAAKKISANQAHSNNRNTYDYTIGVTSESGFHEGSITQPQ